MADLEKNKQTCKMQINKFSPNHWPIFKVFLVIITTYLSILISWYPHKTCGHIFVEITRPSFLLNILFHPNQPAWKQWFYCQNKLQKTNVYEIRLTKDYSTKTCVYLKERTKRLCILQCFCCMQTINVFIRVTNYRTPNYAGKKF